ITGCGASHPNGASEAAPMDSRWHDRVIQVFDILTKQSLHPASADVIGAAGWRALGERSPHERSAEALADRVANMVASHALDTDRAWSVIQAMVDAADNGHTVLLTAEAMKQVMDSI